MWELGVEVPDPASVQISRWTRLQARYAPIDRLLAAREAAEMDEVDDPLPPSYGRRAHRLAAPRDPQGRALSFHGCGRDARSDVDFAAFPSTGTGSARPHHRP
jgi:hypothetical protein